MDTDLTPQGLEFVMARAPRRKPTDIVAVKLRMPESLRLLLEKAAAGHDQSMNSEIVRRLTESFRAPELLDVVRATIKSELGVMYRTPDKGGDKD